MMSSAICSLRCGFLKQLIKCWKIKGIETLINIVKMISRNEKINLRWYDKGTKPKAVDKTVKIVF